MKLFNDVFSEDQVEMTKMTTKREETLRQVQYRIHQSCIDKLLKANGLEIQKVPADGDKASCQAFPHRKPVKIRNTKFAK